MMNSPWWAINMRDPLEVGSLISTCIKMVRGGNKPPSIMLFAIKYAALQKNMTPTVLILTLALLRRINLDLCLTYIYKNKLYMSAYKAVRIYSKQLINKE